MSQANPGFKRSGEPQSGDAWIEIHLGFALFLVRRWFHEEVQLWLEGSQPERRPRLGEGGRVGEVDVEARGAAAGMAALEPENLLRDAGLRGSRGAR